MVRFGIIGTNFITVQLLDSVKDLSDFNLTAVYSRTEEKAKEFAANYGVETIFTDIEEMAKSDKIDAVYIASPNSLHASQALAFLKKGKHVLCEKPLASNTAEVEMMQNEAKENNVVLMEAMKTTLLPNFKSIQEHLFKIGKVRRFFGCYCQYSSRYDAYKEGTILNAFNPSFSNGSLMDLGVYSIYPIVVLFGEPNAIKATGVMLDSGVDGEGSILLQYDGMDATVLHSKISNSYLPSEIQGEEGSILIDKISTPGKVEIRYRDGTNELISRQQDKPFMFYEVEEFINLIKEGKIESQVNSFLHSKITIQIMDEVRKQMGLVYPADLR
ncbi:Gfo/Idh/MocA family protein [Bacillus sp. CGMCC 1.16607]|uniref:Gfo/Idh/MocA family protein n=1 Tax=Bacillus sp. CGMCC 1.16607 TaxID=3351842 RepID=UPI0036262B1A